MNQHSYAVRITHSYEECKALVDQWQLRCDKIVVYEHVGSITEKVHIHMVIEGSECTKKWLREIGSRQGVNLKGNAMCSFKEFDGNKQAIVYMTKGTLDPKYNKGYSQADLDLWKSQWVNKKRSPDQELYDLAFGNEELCKEDLELFKNENPTVVYPEFVWCKRTAYQCAFHNNKFIANLRMINQYKMLVYTYCYRNGVKIPDGDRAFISNA